MTMECSRCGGEADRIFVLDDPMNPEVCPDCLKGTDEVLDL